MSVQHDNPVWPGMGDGDVLLVGPQVALSPLLFQTVVVSKAPRAVGGAQARSHRTSHSQTMSAANGMSANAVAQMPLYVTVLKRCLPERLPIYAIEAGILCSKHHGFVATGPSFEAQVRDLFALRQSSRSAGGSRGLTWNEIATGSGSRSCRHVPAGQMTLASGEVGDAANTPHRR